MVSPANIFFKSRLNKSIDIFGGQVRFFHASKVKNKNRSGLLFRKFNSEDHQFLFLLQPLNQNIEDGLFIVVLTNDEPALIPRFILMKDLELLWRVFSEEIP